MHFINKDRHFKFARILSKYHLLPTSPRNRCGFSNLCSCSRPSHERCWSFEPLSPCLFLPFTPLLEMIRRHTCCALRTDLIQDFHHHLNSIEPSNQFTLETESAGQLNMELWEIHWHKRLRKTNTHKQVPRFHLPSFPSPPDISSMNPAFQGTCPHLVRSIHISRSQEELNISWALAQNSYPARFIQHHSRQHMTALPKTKNPPQYYT